MILVYGSYLYSDSRGHFSSLEFYSSCITEAVDKYCCLAMRFDRFDINGVLDFFFSTDNWNRLPVSFHKANHLQLHPRQKAV